MELIYVWLEDLHPFEKYTDVKLSNQFNIKSTVNTDTQTIQLDIEKNEDFIPNFFGSKISNVTAFIGKNGTGKTSLLQFLIKIFNNPQRSGHWVPNYIAVFYDNKTSKVYIDAHNTASNGGVQHLFEDPNFNFEGNENIITNTSLSITVNTLLEWEYINQINPTQTVFYSPIVDFSHFPIYHDNKPYADVSTDFLLIHDAFSVDGDKNPIEIHRYKNVERQISFVKKFGNNNNIKNRFPLPSELTLIGLNPIKEESDWKWNLSSSARDIRIFFIGEEWAGMGGCIENEKQTLRSTIHSINQNIIPDNQSIKQAKTSEIKLIFLWYFIGHFFKSLNGEYHELSHGIGVSVEELKGKNAWDAFRYFLEKQSWTTDNGKAAINFLDELNKVFNLDMIEVNDYHENDVIQLLDLNMMLAIPKAHIDYKKSLPIWEKETSITDLIQFNWRNLSSGEKAFLDIFSRFLYAKQQIDDKKIKSTVEYIYLLIDEGELGFHPEWQRQYLNLILDIVPEVFKGIKLQIILTSHSPFVISDLPKDNIVFLKREKDKPTTVDNKHIEIQNTFAGNIHTLLADGFFLEHGLIGAFAQKKIKDALKQIDHKDLNQKSEIQRLIEIIGEPIIRQKMRQLFEEKYGQESPEEEIERLERQLREAKNKLNQSS